MKKTTLNAFEACEARSKKSFNFYKDVEFRQEPPHAVVVHSWPVFFTTGFSKHLRKPNN